MPMWVVDVLIRLALGGVFVAAGVIKGSLALGVAAPPVTLHDLYVPEGWRLVFAAGEVLLGVWIITGLWRRVSGTLTLLALAVFSILMAAEMRRPDPRPCGCLVREVLPGVNDAEAVRAELRRSLARNGGLTLAGLWLVFHTPVRRGAITRRGTEATDRQAASPS